jgi:GNAT superfamily N-acetyltransferase
MASIRFCRPDECAAIAAIINAAAEAYRGIIPADRWHDPYMSSDELDHEIAAGVTFWCYDEDGMLTGVMGLQPVRDVDLIRHAYVVPARQRDGVGGRLLRHMCGMPAPDRC